MRSHQLRPRRRSRQLPSAKSDAHHRAGLDCSSNETHRTAQGDRAQAAPIGSGDFRRARTVRISAQPTLTFRVLRDFAVKPKTAAPAATLRTVRLWGHALVPDLRVLRDFAVKLKTAAPAATLRTVRPWGHAPRP